MYDHKWKPRYGFSQEQFNQLPRIIPRIVKYKKRTNEGGEAILFLPDISANPGNIMSYQHLGQHGEASIDFFTRETLAPKPGNETKLCATLIAEYERQHGAHRIRRKWVRKTASQRYFFMGNLSYKIKRGERHEL